MPAENCTLQKWCKRPNRHDGSCKKKPTIKDLERMLRDGLATDAEKELWKRLGGGR